ncbi:MAG: PDZ domain-containing protein [Gemmataceae bacterium]|nr:PDZ domain-containing protein [Gemmataceae bacterium]
MRFCSLGWAMVFLALGTSIPTLSARTAEPDKIYTLDRPPTEVADALRDLLADDIGKRRAAGRALARLPSAEPYLRHFRTTAAGKGDGFAGDALDELARRRGEQVVERAPQWGKDGRFDLLVDASLHLTADQADKVAEQFFAIGKAVRPVPEKMGGPKCKYGLGADHAGVLLKRRELFRLHAPDHPVETDMATWGFVRARACETTAPKLFRWLFVTRDSLRGAHAEQNEWENCYVFHNGKLVLDDINWSLVVCDGDVECVNQAHLNGCVVIARGSIRCQPDLRFPQSNLYAQGDIIAKGSHTSDGLLFAGGKIDVPAFGKGAKERVEKAGVKECPFPVRFFETADVGVEAAFKDGKLTVAKLTPGSPLAKHGVKEGDVVTRVNDKDITSADDFRRELRYSVALEAGILHITRSDQKVTRVVYFKNGLEK